MAKLLLEARGLRKSYGERELLKIDALKIYDGERIGLIGENGAGKSTLLSILAGRQDADEGILRRMGSAAMAGQLGDSETEADGHLQSLLRAPEEHEGLSGGELTRRRIAAALSAHPQLLMLDEPTTDLDEEGRRVLIRQLEGFTGALILISHDRALLRRFCTRIWHLGDGKLTVFPGGYDAFRAEQQRQRESAQAAYEQYRSEQERLRVSAQRMAERASSVRKAPSRMGNSEARLHKREATDAVLRLSHAKRTLQNRMEQMEVKERPRDLPEIRVKLGVAHPIGARTVLSLRCGCMTAGSQVLLEQTGLNLPTGSHTALLGPNGCGKTTLLSALSGQLPPGTALEGDIRWHSAVRLGWFDQHHDRTLRGELSVLENLMESSVLPECDARTILACLGFRREDAFKPVSALSGGERAKAALARLMLMDCNVLLLDEPTNHLDLYAMEALEELLSGYGGTLLFVSHDEAFVNKVATRTVRFADRQLFSGEGSPEEQRREQALRQLDQDRLLQISSLEMRLADLAARMARPRRGDSPEALNAEYLQVAEALRQSRNDQANS